VPQRHRRWLGTFGGRSFPSGTEAASTGRNWSNIESYMDRYYKDKVSKTKRKKMSRSNKGPLTDRIGAHARKGCTNPNEDKEDNRSLHT
jgi:hypothetical protein